jgi:polygalacturonase
MLKMKTNLIIILSVFLNAYYTGVYASDYNIVDYGAISDTSVLSTKAIQKAIDTCNSSGGGIVNIPAGSYKTGSIFLRDNVILNIENGATLYGSTNLADYKKIKPAYVSLRTQEATIQLIYAENAVNTGITGNGLIDGQGKGFAKLTEHDEGITRPHLIRFITCKNITIKDINLKNSGCWMQHYLACDELNIDGIKVFNRNNFNNDALDIDGCHNVTVSNIICDSDDDGITLKSTSPRLCENIAINNCVISSRCNAIKLGTETNGGFKNIAISNCVVKPSKIEAKAFYGREKGLAGIALEIVDGGLMEGVSISGVQIDGTTAPIFIRLGNRARSYSKDIEINNVGSINHVSLSNIKAINAGETGCSITGIPGFNPTKISLNNISVNFTGGGTKEDILKDVPEKPKEYPESTMFGDLPAYGFYIRHASNITMSDIILSVKDQDFRPAIFLDDVNKSLFSNIQLQNCSETGFAFFMNNCNSVIIKDNVMTGIKGKIANKSENSDGIIITGNIPEK